MPPPSGGIASWTVRYLEYCKAEKIPLEIVNIATTGKRASSETKSINILKEVSRTRRIVNESKRKCRDFQPDIIHFNTSCSPLGVIRDALCMRICAKKAPVVLHCRCNIEDQLKGSFSKKIFSYLVHKSSKVIVLNDFSKNYVEAIQPGKAIYIPNFIKEGVITNQHSIRSNISTAVSVGHVQAEKGLIELLDTAKLCPDIQFVLVGAVRDKVSDDEIPCNVLMTGRMDMDGVQTWLDKSDVFVFPTKTEGFSNALLEAMARGLPCIVTDVGANKLMIENHGGYVLQSCSGSEIKKAIEKMTDPKVRSEMSAWNIEKVSKAYRSETIMSQYFDLYRIAIGHDGGV